MKLLETLQKIDRLDQLIRLKATGTPTNLANKLHISERSVRRLINTMKEMGAPIGYSIYRKSYYYKENVEFQFGFFCKEDKTKKLFGGGNHILKTFLFRNLFTVKT